MDELTASVRHYDRMQVVERLKELELRGGSHAMLSAVCACVRPVHHGWTAAECRALAEDLAAMLAAGDKLDGTWKAERDRALEELGRLMGELEDYMAPPLDAENRPLRVGEAATWRGRKVTVRALQVGAEGWTALVEPEGCPLVRVDANLLNMPDSPDALRVDAETLVDLAERHKFGSRDAFQRELRTIVERACALAEEAGA